VVGEGYTIRGGLHNAASERESQDKAVRISVKQISIVGAHRIGELATCLHAEPDTRMTAMAAFPEAVDSA
jgi:hypothetical protein